MGIKSLQLYELALKSPATLPQGKDENKIKISNKYIDLAREDDCWAISAYRIRLFHCLIYTDQYIILNPDTAIYCHDGLVVNGSASSVAGLGLAL